MVVWQWIVEYDIFSAIIRNFLRTSGMHRSVELLADETCKFRPLLNSQTNPHLT